jgi:hypothetical protein
VQGDSDVTPPYHAANVSVTIPGVLLKFLERASLAVAGTRDRDRVPHFHWVAGWSVEPDPGSLAFFLGEPFAERLLRHVAECPRLALTIEHIGPHETYQFKGAFAGSRPVAPADLAASKRCRERFVRDVLAIDTRWNFSPEQLTRYHGGPALAVVLNVDEIYLQTPGPGAGRRIVPAEPR